LEGGGHVSSSSSFARISPAASFRSKHGINLLVFLFLRSQGILQPFVKVVKNKAYFKRYQVKFRRRRGSRNFFFPSV
jgi:hypothetical protein